MSDTKFFWLPSLDQTGNNPDGGALDAHHHQLAAEWLRAYSADGATGLVVANTKKTIGYHDEYTDFQHYTPASRIRPNRNAPVLALFPNLKTLRQAERLAAVALCVLGGYDSNLDYWIEDRNAQPLSDFVVESLPPLATDAAAALDSALLWGGNNGFNGSHEKNKARDSMKSLRRLQTPPTAKQVAAYMTSRHINDGIDWYCEEYDPS